MKNEKVATYTDFASVIGDMINAGTSIEDIATLFTDALNAESKRQEEMKKNVAKEKDAVELMKLIAAFLATHYGDTTWDETAITNGAKEFVTILDEVYKVMPAFKSLLTPGTKSKITITDVVPPKVEEFDPVKIFEDFVKNL